MRDRISWLFCREAGCAEAPCCPQDQTAHTVTIDPSIFSGGTEDRHEHGQHQVQLPRPLDRQISMDFPSLLTAHSMLELDLKQIAVISPPVEVDDVLDKQVNQATPCKASLDWNGPQHIPPSNKGEQRILLAKDAKEKADLAQEEVARLEVAKEQRQLEEEERKVHAFLKAHGFSDVNGKKKNLWRAVYPLHSAAAEGDDDMVQLLLKAGAEASRANSIGQTAEAVARKNNINGSHELVLIALREWKVKSSA